MNYHQLDALRYGAGRYISIHNIRLPKEPPPLTPITADYQILDPEKLEPKALPKP